MYLFSASHGHGRSGLAGSSSGYPTEWMPRTKSSLLPSASRTRCPTRVMMCMLATTYGESVTITPTLAMGEPTGPME